MTAPSHSNPPPASSSVSRRRFLAGSGAAALGLTVMIPDSLGAVDGSGKVKLGLIGCGGRGAWIANLFREHGGYELVGAADYFQDRLDNVGNKFGLAKSRLFAGLNGYRRMLELEELDAVAIESPPYFHPEQAAAAVAAGKHVYLAKPPAVDVPGCQSIADSGRTATGKDLVFLVDFQTRADPYFIEALKRVRRGALGESVFGEAIYHANCPFRSKYKALQADPTNMENRLRAWGLDRVLSGDIIVEQNIHTLDVMNWIMGEPPVSAVGVGGRTVRPCGDCYDHFALLFNYPNNVGITFSSRQINGHGTQPEGIRNRMFGSEGVLQTQYGDQVIILGDNAYDGGRSPGIYQEGAKVNITTFHRSIRERRYDNPTVAPSVRSDLVSVLGRMAAYHPGRIVTWDEMMRKNERLEIDLGSLKS